MALGLGRRRTHTTRKEMQFVPKKVHAGRNGIAMAGTPPLRCHRVIVYAKDATRRMTD